MGRMMIDDYNGMVGKDQDIMGTTPNCGSSAPQRIQDYRDIRYVQDK